MRPAVRPHHDDRGAASPLQDGLERGRACNTKAAAAAAVGEVVAMWLKVDGLAREPIYTDAEKERFENQTKVWAILNALRSHGVKLASTTMPHV